MSLRWYASPDDNFSILNSLQIHRCKPIYNRILILLELTKILRVDSLCGSRKKQFLPIYFTHTPKISGVASYWNREALCLDQLSTAMPPKILFLAVFAPQILTLPHAHFLQPLVRRTV